MVQTEVIIRGYLHYHTKAETSVPSIVAAQEERVAEVLRIIDQQLSDKSNLLDDTLPACDYFLFTFSEWCRNLTYMYQMVEKVLH